MEKKLYDDSWVLKIKQPQNTIQEEYGSMEGKVRFITSLEESTGRCLDCEAKSHIFALEGINMDPIDTPIKYALNEIKDALLWILNNTSYPVGD